MEEIEYIKQDPYRRIREHYESMLPFIGSRVFSILSLLPVSTIIPKLVINNREIRSHINLLWLSPPGHGKSTLSNEFEKITYNPIRTKKISIPRLYFELKKKNNKPTSLIVEDIATWFMDAEKIKFLEGISGEESSMSHETMKNIKDTEKHTNLIGFCSGTPENITNQSLGEGIIRRFSPLILFLSQEEHKQMIYFINKNIGGKPNLKDSEEIKNFYDELYQIQEGNHSEISKIIGYILPSEEKRLEISDFIYKITNGIHTKFSVSCATENEEFWRFAISLAFLRIFEKYKKGMVEDNHLVIDEEDMKVAKSLIAREISTKSVILSCLEQLDYYGIKTREQLKNWENRRRLSGHREIPKEAKFIMYSNVKK